MNEQLISWILALEVALPFVVLCIILSVILIGAKKKNKAAVRALILRIKNNEQNQKDAIQKFLVEKLGIESDKAKKNTKKIVNERKFLFRNLISVLLDKNMDALVQLEDDLSRITQHYHKLEVARAEAPKDEVEEEGEDVDALKQEIKSLKHEIHITLTTLNNIFAEFSSMFGEEVPDKEMSVDQIITAMETFSGKKAEAEGESEDVEAMLDDPDEPDAFSELEVDDLDVEDEAQSEAEPDITETETAQPATLEDESLEEGESEAVESIAEEASMSEEESPIEEMEETQEESLDFSIDSELDDIDSALDELELGSSGEEEPSWDEAFAESGDELPDEK